MVPPGERRIFPVWCAGSNRTRLVALARGLPVLGTMSDGMNSAVAAMRAAERQMEGVATNLANVDVHGYKRVTTATRSFDRVLEGQRRRVIDVESQRDFSQGSLVMTGNPMDLALHGEGFFSIETPDGEAFTRGGRFRLDEAGVLQTQEGYPVAWDGARGTIDPQGVEVEVDFQGQMWQGPTQVGRLKLVHFADVSRLSVDRGGMFRDLGGLERVPHKAEVRQATLESANSSAVDELVSLVTIQRRFEAAAKVVSMIEQSFRRLNNARA